MDESSEILGGVEPSALKEIVPVPNQKGDIVGGLGLSEKDVPKEPTDYKYIIDVENPTADQLVDWRTNFAEIYTQLHKLDSLDQSNPMYDRWKYIRNIGDLSQADFDKLIEEKRASEATQQES